jgi:Na+/H+-dicarboxylate symporter
MQPSTASSNFPEIKVPALLTFLALIVGFVVGNLFQGVAGFAPALAAAEEVGGLWLKLLQLTILPLVIGLVVTGISQTLAAAGGGRLARRAVLYFVVVLLFAGVMAALLVPALPLAASRT